MDKLHNFHARRSIERLRSGLCDSVAMSYLTMEETCIKKKFSQGLTSLEKGLSEHLCICGSYGQGKSHMLTYLHQHALSQGYATSFVQLDLRETPFHQFSVVYQSLMRKLSLPDGKNFVAAWKKWGRKQDWASGNSVSLNTMPHRFYMILRSMLSKNQPKESPCLLEKALMGDDVPAIHLKKIFKDHVIEAYQKQSITCRGNLPYAQMVQALGHLLQEMGYKGLVLFFDEAESIAQVRLGQRAKSYEILDHFFKNNDAIYPVFALTADFFDKVNHEPYAEKPTFLKNYAEEWKDLNRIQLQDFSSDAWKLLQDRLIKLYAKAYRMDISTQTIAINEKLNHLLDKLQAQETRFKLKALVNQLDIETQHS